MRMGLMRNAMLAVAAGAFLLPTLLAARAETGRHLTVFRASTPPPGAEALCSAVPGSCGSNMRARSPDSEAVLALARDVNRAVNATLQPLQDPAGMGRSWTPPATGAGDCKHYAVLKKQRLVQAGVDPGRLMLAVVAGRGPEMHAVLVLRTGTGDLVLDNLSDQILGWRESGYTFLKMQRAGDGRRWDLILEGPRASRS